MSTQQILSNSPYTIVDKGFLERALAADVNPEVIADVLTRHYTAFQDFADLLAAKGSYRPTMDMRQKDLQWLADYYDKAQKKCGDPRRVYRCGMTYRQGKPVMP